MRFALADSGDTVEDANFVEKQAEAGRLALKSDFWGVRHANVFFVGLLRLYSYLDWAREIVKSADQLRTGKSNFYTDRVFSRSVDIML